jgi:hypothetical protein
MDGIEGLLARDFGVRPQGKAAPMDGVGASRNATGSDAAWSNPGRTVPASTAAPSYDDLFGAPAPAPVSASSSSFERNLHLCHLQKWVLLFHHPAKWLR